MSESYILQCMMGMVVVIMFVMWIVESASEVKKESHDND